MSEREGKVEAKRLWEAGEGRNEISRRTGVPRSTITRWVKVWEATKPPPTIISEEERLRSLASGDQYQIPETVHIANEEEHRQYLFLLEQAGGDHGRIARVRRGGPFRLLPPPPPPMSRQDFYDMVYSSRGSREARKRRRKKKYLKQVCDYYGYTHPLGYSGE